MSVSDHYASVLRPVLPFHDELRECTYRNPYGRPPVTAISGIHASAGDSARNNTHAAAGPIHHVRRPWSPAKDGHLSAFIHFCL